ncbi:MAG: ABC transporter substrate-binding protein [Candidatus Caldatribacteriota bacterium]|nr:ABC transporter substrate-binding protein [Candidatus Caldatribacteriota bacterium]
MKKIVTLVILIILIVSALSIMVAAADTLVIYASVDEGNAKKILDAFSSQTGIEAEFVHLSSGPAMARISAEANNPQADVWLGAPSENHVVLKEEGLTIAYKSEAMEKLAPSFKDPDGFWRSFYMNPMALAVNTEALEKANASKPTSWEDLLKPEYKELIQMPTPQSSGTAYAIITTLVTVMGEDEAYEYMKKLNPNIQTYTSSGTGPSKGVAVGAAAIGIQFTPAFFEFIEEGYPLEVIFPSEGVGFEAPAVSIIKGAKNLESAKILIDWLVSKDGQDVLSQEKTFFYPVIPEANLSKGMPAFSELKTIEVDNQWAGENKKRLVERWVNEVLPAK